VQEVEEMSESGVECWELNVYVLEFYGV